MLKFRRFSSPLVFFVVVILLVYRVGASFSPITGPVSALMVQPDGHILVGGQFSEESSLVRLQSNGDTDPSFQPVFKNSAIAALAMRDDGRIWVGGYFGATAASPHCQGLILLEPSGEVNHAFCRQAAEGFNSRVESVALQQDGRVVVGGSFTRYGSHAAPALARVNSDGTLDREFQQNLGEAISSAAYVQSVAVQPDGKILVLGNFQRFNGKPTEGLVRLFPDGSEDVEFSETVNRALFTGFSAVDSEEEMAGLGVFLSKVWSQEDGGILVSGEFVIHDEKDTVYQLRFIRLKNSGAVDYDFMRKVNDVGISSDVNTFAVLPDGNVVVGANHPFACLKSDGSLDPICYPVAYNSLSGGIGAMLPQDDGKLLVGGFFTQYRGVKVSNLIRLNVDGTLDETFLVDTISAGE